MCGKSVANSCPLLPCGSLDPPGISQNTQGPGCNGQVSVRVVGGAARVPPPAHCWQVRPAAPDSAPVCVMAGWWLTPLYLSPPTDGAASWIEENLDAGTVVGVKSAGGHLLCAC